jgi:hypothetical protein
MIHHCRRSQPTDGPDTRAGTRDLDTTVRRGCSPLSQSESFLLRGVDIAVRRKTPAWRKACFLCGGNLRHDRCWGYSKVRRPDPRLGGLIGDALGDAGSILGVGLEQALMNLRGRQVVAVGPSSVMLSQHSCARRVWAVAESLPLAGSVEGPNLCSIRSWHRQYGSTISASR